MKYFILLVECYRLCMFCYWINNFTIYINNIHFTKHAQITCYSFISYSFIIFTTNERIILASVDCINDLGGGTWFVITCPSELVIGSAIALCPTPEIISVKITYAPPPTVSVSCIMLLGKYCERMLLFVIWKTGVTHFWLTLKIGQNFHLKHWKIWILSQNVCQK